MPFVVGLTGAEVQGFPRPSLAVEAAGSPSSVVVKRKNPRPPGEGQAGGTQIVAFYQ
jgi:hypothetical protein